MIISVASGKGGTGKTTVAVNLALSLDKKLQFLDCDVEEPNAHLFLKPTIEKIEPSFIKVPKIDESLCNLCGRCSSICEYNALAVIPKTEKIAGRVMVFQQLCHGCGGCMLLCPQKAITEVDRKIGVVEIGRHKDIQFIHGKIDISEPMAPPLIRHVKKYIDKDGLTISDCPPGTSCPVVTSVKGSDFCILVTEPTPFGLHDLSLAVELLRKINIKFAIALNKSGPTDKIIDDYCKKENISILIRIPFDKKIASAYSKGENIVEVFPEYKNDFKDLFNKIISIVKKQ
ncbi:MAG: ATP-binding protein [Candidatus Gygaella obscura]|nr:ATP-binding protein [Candidatus Gygaella obscura]